MDTILVDMAALAVSLIISAGVAGLLVRAFTKEVR
jgi:hypothetical protein